MSVKLKAKCMTPKENFLRWLEGIAQHEIVAIHKRQAECNQKIDKVLKLLDSIIKEMKGLSHDKKIYKKG